MKNFLQTTIDILNDVNLSTSSKTLRISEQAVFFNQEFSFELIVNLFKGWEIKHYINNLSGLGYTYLTLSDYPGYEYYQYKQNTIDDFVTDCQQLNIELERE